MHKYIHEYDNEWGYFVKIDDICKDEYKYEDEYKYQYQYQYQYENEYEYEDEDKYKYKNNKNEEDKNIVQHNKHENINKSLFIYFVVTVLMYICYILSFIPFNKKYTL